MTFPPRRRFIQAAGALLAGAGLPLASAQAERRFTPTPGRWRRFEVTTRIELLDAQGASQVWLPVPSLDTGYQRSLASRWTGNAGVARIVSDQKYGAKMLHAQFVAGTASPMIELVSTVQTQDRATDWNRAVPGADDAASLRAWTTATELIPIDGIVRETAIEVARGAISDVDKVQRIYEWVVNTTYREPLVRGCGVGDVKSMLETGNFGGKCGDINALFVGLCRSVGVPARDVYGLRLAPSAFGYRELSGNPAKLQGAQHCRAEVYLKQHGWVAMDPADVGKVMRLETGTWIKDTRHPVVAPVMEALFGGWEGNWLGYNMAHDVALPGSDGPVLGFLMYPQAENAKGRYDPLEPDRFRYTITAREV
ncbi:transglutaminase domain-containing protein [Schlegelella sp. S2-27]|uniref:Transglutaminase domain-containing protein n=1 Tax=Caldimonas mangrovi TaxID=2944811 RepID=A0ABT0YHV9_9BURK|nr:transglutaminase domain-containing protein [Caldimonas mangrovi]MCM5678300.1 transglutaminase domain-containing protein [Caldimonas mangrovi]